MPSATVRSAYRPHSRHQVQFHDRSLAKQGSKDECDINFIMRKYEKTQLLDHLNQHQGDYANLIGFEDYQTSLNLIREAEEVFGSIPSAIRTRFENDPSVFLNFVQNPDNADELVEMGLANRPPAPAADPPAPPAPPPPGEHDPSD